MQQQRGDLGGHRYVLARGNGPRADVAGERRMDDGVFDGFARHRPCALHAARAKPARRRFLESSAARVERGLILLSRGVGLRLRGIGLRAEFFVGALRNVAGLEQIRVALGVGFGQARLGGGGIGIGFRGEHFGHGVGVELTALARPMRDCAWRNPASACCSLASA